MSDKVYGIKENKSLVEITSMDDSMNLNGSQTIVGEKTFEKIRVKDFEISNSASGASVKFKVQDGGSFELILPEKAGTIALESDVDTRFSGLQSDVDTRFSECVTSLYQHNIVLVMHSDSSGSDFNLYFDVTNTSASPFTTSEIINWLIERLGGNGDKYLNVNVFKLSASNPKHYISVKCIMTSGHYVLHGLTSAGVWEVICYLQTGSVVRVHENVIQIH